MAKRINCFLSVVCIVMVFTAQTYRPDEKGQQHAPGARPAPSARPASSTRPAPSARPAALVVHDLQSRTHVQTRREVSQQIIHRSSPVIQGRAFQPFHQERVEPRVYAVPMPVPVENNRLFEHQHHNNWQPLYNFYNNQYQFYPYVNVAATVDLSADVMTVLFNGQTYYYDRGRFYQQDDQGQYFAVPPPIGIIVSALPDHARQVIVNDQVYYRYKGVFYVQVPQGFQVVGPVQ